MIRGVLSFIICFMISFSFGQDLVITGMVKDKEGKAIPNVNVLLKQENKIKSFGHTNKEGVYTITAESSVLKEAFLEANHLAYQPQKTPLLVKQTVYNFILDLRENEIDEVSIGKAVPIKQRKDTLVYSVQAFADSMDRSIGEVMKRMPGFNVSESGKISYNGQDISYFFIDGDDVLGSKYGLGTKNIPHAIISAVEVYRNHQAIKALEDKVNSNQVAINLKVKDDTKTNWISDTKLGTGLPKLYLIDFNAIMFNKNVKTINALKAGNTGEDIESLSKELTSAYLDNNEKFWLSSGSVDPVSAHQNTFYKNNGIGAFFNLFKNLGKDWSQRGNIGANYDKRLLSTSTLQTYKFPNIQQEISDNTSLTYS
jgi:hypothetical protein